MDIDVAIALYAFPHPAAGVGLLCDSVRFIHILSPGALVIMHGQPLSSILVLPHAEKLVARIFSAWFHILLTLVMPPPLSTAS